MRWPIVFAGLSGAVMVAMGAYAAHSGSSEVAQSWLHTGAQYGLWHSIALVAVAAVGMRAPASRLLTASAVLFAAGIVLFSGSLFLRALLEWSWIAPATPTGGLCFIAGWLLLAVYGATRYLDNESSRP